MGPLMLLRARAAGSDACLLGAGLLTLTLPPNTLRAVPLPVVARLSSAPPQLCPYLVPGSTPHLPFPYPPTPQNSEAYPHLIFDGVSSALGKRLSGVLKHLFPVPKDDSKRVVTFANRDDYVSFRHHTHAAPAGPKSIELKEVSPGARELLSPAVLLSRRAARLGSCRAAGALSFSLAPSRPAACSAPGSCCARGIAGRPTSFTDGLPLCIRPELWSLYLTNPNPRTPAALTPVRPAL